MFVLVIYKNEPKHIHVPNPNEDSYDTLHKAANGDMVLLYKLIKQVNLYLLSEKKPLVRIPAPAVPRCDEPVLSEKDVTYVENLAKTINMEFELDEEKTFQSLKESYDAIENLHRQSPYKEFLLHYCQQLHHDEQAWIIQEGNPSADDLYVVVCYLYENLRLSDDVENLLYSWREALSAIKARTKNELIKKWNKRLKGRVERVKELKEMVKQY